jgi:hypothetical protein
VAAGFTPQQTADAVEDFWVAIQSQISNAFTMTVDPEVRQLNEATGVLLSVSPVTVTSRVMNGTGERLDLLQGLLTWNTGDVVDGRVVKGRTFLPGPMETMNEPGGVPTTAYKTTINSAAAALQTALPNALVVWHRPVNEAGGSIHEVILGAVNSSWSYLQSRRN